MSHSRHRKDCIGEFRSEVSIWRTHKFSVHDPDLGHVTGSVDAPTSWIPEIDHRGYLKDVGRSEKEWTKDFDINEVVIAYIKECDNAIDGAVERYLTKQREKLRQQSQAKLLVTPDSIWDTSDASCQLRESHSEHGHDYLTWYRSRHKTPTFSNSCLFFDHTFTVQDPAHGQTTKTITVNIFWPPKLDHNRGHRLYGRYGNHWTDDFDVNELVTQYIRHSDRLINLAMKDAKWAAVLSPSWWNKARPQARINCETQAKEASAVSDPAPPNSYYL